MGLRSLWIPVGATAVCFLLGGTAWVTRDQAEVRERLARFVAAASAAEPPMRREAVYGETLDGNACDDYVAASEALTPLRLECRHVNNTAHLEWVRRGEPLTEDARRAIAPALDVALQSIRRGVRRATLRFPERRVMKFELQATLDDAIDRAFAVRDGRSLAELYVDRWVLSGDVWPGWWRSPFRDEWLLALDAETAVWFDAALRRLDERTPLSCSPRGNIAQAVRDVADLTPLQQSFGMGLEAWRYGCDWYWRSLVFCDRLLANEGELEPPARDWAKRRAQIDAFGSVIDADATGWAAQIPRMLLGDEWARRSLATQLRFLRLAVAFVHRLELPVLEDPLGSGLIEVAVDGDEATFRSEGMAGKQRVERTVRRR